MHNNNLITAIASGSVTAMQRAATGNAFTIEQWKRTPDGAFANEQGTSQLTEAEFITYFENRNRKGLIFLSCENLTEEQIKKFVKHEE